MPTTKDRLAFVHTMARHTRATVRQCEALMRYAATLQRLAEDDCNVATDDAGLNKRLDKRDRIREHVQDIIDDLNKGTDMLGHAAVYSGDPRGAVLKIRVPDGFSNSFAGEGICVPS